MKKLQKLLSLSLLAVVVTACGPGGNGLTAKQVQDAIEKPVKEEVVEVETVERTTFGYTVTETRIVKADGELGKLHSVNGEPSVIYANAIGKVIEIGFHKEGKLHRDVGPALIGYQIKFFKNDELVITWDNELDALIATDNTYIQNADELTNEEFEILGGEEGVGNYNGLVIPVIVEAKKLLKSFN